MLDPVLGMAEALAPACVGDRRGPVERRAARGLLRGTLPALSERDRAAAPPRLLAALRAVDPLLGELFAALWRSGAPELIAIKLAGALSTDAGGAPAYLHEALVATALFAIADALFARVDDAVGKLDAWTPHLLAADCALAEGLGALAGVPGPAAERLSDAFVLASGARLDGTRGCPVERSLAERLVARTRPARVLAELATGRERDGRLCGEALETRAEPPPEGPAGPSRVCAAGLAASTSGGRSGAGKPGAAPESDPSARAESAGGRPCDGDADRTVDLAAWVATTAFALAEADGPEAGRARELLAAQITALPPVPGDARSLSSLARRIRRRASRVLGTGAAPITNSTSADRGRPRAGERSAASDRGSPEGSAR